MDYKTIAAAIVKTRARIENSRDIDTYDRHHQLRGVRRTAAHIADAMDMHAHDRIEFLKLCGYGS
jgi:hypothetical protein